MLENNRSLKGIEHRSSSASMPLTWNTHMWNSVCVVALTRLAWFGLSIELWRCVYQQYLTHPKTSPNAVAGTEPLSVYNQWTFSNESQMWKDIDTHRPLRCKATGCRGFAEYGHGPKDLLHERKMWCSILFLGGFHRRLAQSSDLCCSIYFVASLIYAAPVYM